MVCSSLGVLGAVTLVVAYFMGSARWSPAVAIVGLALCATSYALVERTFAGGGSRLRAMAFGGLALVLWAVCVALAMGA